MTLCYGPYVRCSRWWHNTKRIEVLVDALSKVGYGVNLMHEPHEGASGWNEDHGHIALLDTSGTEYARLGNYQHARLDEEQAARTQELVAATSAHHESLGFPPSVPSTTRACTKELEAAGDGKRKGSIFKFGRR